MIKRLIWLAKEIFMDRIKILTGEMNLELKKGIAKCLVWGVTDLVMNY